MEKEQYFSTNYVGTVEHPHAKNKNEPQPKPHTLYKNLLKMDHTSKCKTWNYKTFRRKHRRNRKSSRAGVKQRVLDITSEVCYIKEKIDKLDFIKIQNFCSMHDTVQRMKRQDKGWEDRFEKRIYKKGHLSSILYTELSKLNSKKTRQLISKIGNRFEHTFHQ